MLFFESGVDLINDHYRNASHRRPFTNKFFHSLLKVIRRSSGDERSVISISLLVPFLAHMREPENGEISNNQDKHSVCFITGAVEKKFPI